MTDNTTFEDLFVQEMTEALQSTMRGIIGKHKSEIKSCDPYEDIRNKEIIRIGYTSRPVKKSVPFCDFDKKADLNWFKLLITELKTMQYGHPLDASVMVKEASAKKAKGKTVKQTWTAFVEGLYEDKVVPNKDFTESQLRAVSQLIALLVVDGYKLAGGAPVVFVNEKGEDLL